MVNFDNSDRAALYRNLWKSQPQWGMAEKVMVDTGVPVKSRVMMYKSVFQGFLLYGIKIRMVTDAMVTAMEFFYRRIVRRISNITARRGDGR